MPNACYIHIPFCKKKCKYCSFISFNKPELITGYVYSMLKEINDNYRGELLNSLYIGGGTPSLLPVNLLSKIIKKFNVNDNTEITIEVNPDDCSLEYLEDIHKLGCNRLSIGAQTFNDKHLKLIGRRHNSEQIVNTVKFAKQSGFKNISLDLIYGLPTQTLNDIEDNLTKIIKSDIHHISTYGLKIENGSYWGVHSPELLPDEDLQADMYELINEILSKNDFKRYEISNFARDNYFSRHNLTYWNNEEYYGFGVSAHGYVNGIRYSNFCTLEKYLSNPTTHEYGRVLSEKEKLEEEIFLGFRKTTGLNIENINKKFNIDFIEKYQNILDKYKNYIIKTNEGYAFNLQGTLLSNEILPEFLED